MGTMTGEGHVPGDGDFPGALSAPQVNLLQLEAAILRERVERLRSCVALAAGDNGGVASVEIGDDALCEMAEANVGADRFTVSSLEAQAQAHRNANRVAELEAERIGTRQSAEVANLKARAAELEAEIEGWKAGSAAEAREADRGRTREAELEKCCDRRNYWYEEARKEFDLRVAAGARVAELESDLKAAEIKANDIDAMMLSWGQSVQAAADNRKELLGFAPEMLQGPIDEIIVIHQKLESYKHAFEAVGNHLEAIGTCDHARGDELACAQGGCTYCAMVRAVGEVESNARQTN